jgi:sulfite exporter TauE/SafE
MYSIALAMGLSCGAGCGSVSTPFLTAYVLGKGKTLKSSLLTTLIFSLGKIIVMAILGGLTALIGTELISKDITVFGVELVNLFSYMTLLIGVYLVYRSIKKKSCQSCSSSSKGINLETTKDSHSLKEIILLFTAGVLYGITPCVPLITMLSMSVSLSILNASLLLAFFGLVTCVTPSIIQNLLAGFLSSNIQMNLKKHYKYITGLAGVILIVTSLISII